MSEPLLRVGPSDYARLLSRRRRAAVAPFLLCGAVATAILVIEYRLMLIAFMVMFPALIAVIDVVMVSRAAAAMKSAEVRRDHEWLALSSDARVKLSTITLVRVQPDAVTVVEQLGPHKFKGHLLPVEGAPKSVLVEQLRDFGLNVRIEEATIGTLMALIWGVLANMILGKVSAVLVLGAIGFTIQGFVQGDGPGWEAGACFGGAVASVTVMVLLKRFVLTVPAA
jgi:hypothetical protein